MPSKNKTKENIIEEETTTRTASLDTDNDNDYQNHDDGDDDDIFYDNRITNNDNNNHQENMTMSDYEYAKQLQNEIDQEQYQQQQENSSVNENEDDGEEEFVEDTSSDELIAHYEAQSLAELLYGISHNNKGGGSNDDNGHGHHQYQYQNGSNEQQHDTDLNRRIRDYRFAQKKRKEKYGKERPWGILGLYDYLSGIRIDLEWSEDAAYRRNHPNEPYISWSDFNDAHMKSIKSKPFFTYTILVICTINLIVSIGINGWAVEPLKINPMIGPSAETLVDMGAKVTTLIVDNNEWYRIVSPMILHAGIIHYVVNMLALWFIGTAIERVHGFVNAMILFIIPAIGGTVLSALFLPQYISVGASGGIFGLIGGCIADITLNWKLLMIKNIDEDTGQQVRAIKNYWSVIVVFVGDIIVNCLIGLTPFVDNFTHLGGLIYGFLCGLSMVERLNLGFFGMHRPSKLKRKCNDNKICSFLIKYSGIIISIMLIIITTSILAVYEATTTTNESNGQTIQRHKPFCSACRYVSCVPMPPWSTSIEDKWWYCDDCDFVTGNAIMNENNNIEEGSSSSNGTNSSNGISSIGIYNTLELTCPNGVIESINITSQSITDKNILISKLPTYCRTHCDELFGFAN